MRIYVRIARIARIVGSIELVVIDTRLLYIEKVGPFKLPFFKMCNRCKSSIMEFCNPSLGYHFCNVNHLYRPDWEKYAPILQLQHGGDCLCYLQITKLTEILYSHDMICHQK